MFRLRRSLPVVLLLVGTGVLFADGPVPNIFFKHTDKGRDDYHVAQIWKTRTVVTIQPPDGKKEVLGYETTLVVHWHADTVIDEKEKDKEKASKFVGLKCSLKTIEILEKKEGKSVELSGEAKKNLDALKEPLLKANFKFARTRTGYELTPTGGVPAEQKNLFADPVIGLSLLLAPPLPPMQEIFRQLPTRTIDSPLGRYKIDHWFKKSSSKENKVEYDMNATIVFVPASAGEIAVTRIQDLTLEGKATLDTTNGLLTRLDLMTKQPISRRVELKVGGENKVYEVMLEYDTTLTAEVIKTK